MIDAQEYAGRELLDCDGKPVGRVTDVVSDPVTLEAEWLVVKMGLVAGEHLVPIVAVQNESGSLRTSVHKAEVRTSPKVHQHVLPSTAECEALYRHYGVAA